jgi:hypothetical protein
LSQANILKMDYLTLLKELLKAPSAARLRTCKTPPRTAAGAFFSGVIICRRLRDKASGFLRKVYVFAEQP